MLVLSQEQIKTLKKGNVSRDAEKTKERIVRDVKGASRKVKAEIAALSGQSKEAFYRAYKTGSVNARIVLAIAQTLDVEPQYYTGESDEKKPATFEQILQFLNEHGYGKLTKELTPPKEKRKYNRKPKAESAPAAEKTAPDEAKTEKNQETSDLLNESQTEFFDTTLPERVDVTLSFIDEPKFTKAVEELSEDEAKALLHSLFIRARAGGEAANLANIVKICLLK